MDMQSNIFVEPRIRRALARAYPVFQDRLDDLPRQVGGCAWGAAAIASILGDMGVASEVVIGTFRRGRWKSDHCWARAGGWILDWATGQFKLGHPWLNTPVCDRRYLMACGPELTQPAIVISGWPGDEARQTLAQAMIDWPGDQRAAGEAFEQFLAKIRQAAKLDHPVDPNRERAVDSEEGPYVQALRREGIRP